MWIPHYHEGMRKECDDWSLLPPETTWETTICEDGTFCQKLGILSNRRKHFRPCDQAPSFQTNPITPKRRDDSVCLEWLCSALIWLLTLWNQEKTSTWDSLNCSFHTCSFEIWKMQSTGLSQTSILNNRMTTLHPRNERPVRKHFWGAGDIASRFLFWAKRHDGFGVRAIKSETHELGYRFCHFQTETYGTYDLNKAAKNKTRWEPLNREWFHSKLTPSSVTLATNLRVQSWGRLWLSVQK